jgi:hypothetical protein
MVRPVPGGALFRPMRLSMTGRSLERATLGRADKRRLRAVQGRYPLDYAAVFSVRSS